MPSEATTASCEVALEPSSLMLAPRGRIHAADEASCLALWTCLQTACWLDRAAGPWHAAF